MVFCFDFSSTSFIKTSLSTVKSLFSLQKIENCHYFINNFNIIAEKFKYFYINIAVMTFSVSPRLHFQNIQI
nr:MAG TPA: hypothetical protein [Caudoviricetes sp.]